ncbi:MAG: hypothetical protein ACSHW1_10380 [Yoonia sp.]|uniref:hypothetical protein n=1 Tax=Yoonia sp. TaxID=2212373 RepID=UPI003EF5F6DD
MKLEYSLGVIGVIVALGFGVVALIPDPYKVYVAAGFVLACLCFMIAAAKMSSTAPAQRLCDSLENPNGKTLYTATLKSILLWAYRKTDAPEPQGDEPVVTLFANSLTHRLFDWSMRIAVVYPIILLILPWALFARPMALGTTEILAAPDPAWVGPLSLVPLALFFIVRQVLEWWAASPQRFVRSFAGWLKTHDMIDLVAFAVTFAFAGAVTFAFAGAFAGAFAVAVAVAVAVTFAVSVAGAFAGAFAVAVAVAVAVTFAVTFAVSVAGAVAVTFAVAFAGAFAFDIGHDALLARDMRKSASLVAIAFPLAALLIAAHLIDFTQVNEYGRVFFLFFGLAPIVNAVFDTLSYAATMALSARGYRGWPLFWGLIDAAIACILFLGLGATLVVAVSVLEAVSGTDLIDLGGLLAQADDFGRYWWLYAMLFSTALPTLVHLVVAAVSLQGWTRQRWRNRLSAMIKEAGAGDNYASIVAPLALGGMWSVSIVLVLGGMGALFYGIWGYTVEPFLAAYRDVLLDLAIYSGGI